MSSRGRRRGKAKAEKKESPVEELEEEAKKVERAVVKEVKKVEKAVEKKGRKKAAIQRPAGHIPQAMETARHGVGTITRPGRGFSFGELSGSGLAPGQAASWGVRIDTRRRSVLDGNVSSLRTGHSQGGKTRVEGVVKEAVKEVEMLGGEIEKEAVAVEKEAAKAGKAVKKEGEKVEKAVKKKVVRKPRPKKKP